MCDGQDCETGGCQTSGTSDTVVTSPHVMAATGIDRGMTPAVWNAVAQPSVTGLWKGVDMESGPADIATGHVTGCFESAGRWEQT
jgi:hypothetical protein